MPTSTPSTSSSSFKMDSMALNDRAVQLMQEAHYEQATHVLRHALNIVRTNLTSTTSPSTTETPGAIRIEHVEIMHLATEARKHENDAFFLCSQAFVCHTYSTTTSTSPSSNNNDEDDDDAKAVLVQACISSVLFYNLALCVHLQSLEACNGTAKKIQCSLRMYDMALQALPQQDGDETRDHLLPLILAAVNNKGHVYSSFYYQRELSHCLSNMQCLLEHFEDEYHLHGQEWYADSDRELCFQFQLNLIVFAGGCNNNKNASCAPPAPAA